MVLKNHSVPTNGQKNMEVYLILVFSLIFNIHGRYSTYRYHVSKTSLEFEGMLGSEEAYLVPGVPINGSKVVSVPFFSMLPLFYHTPVAYTH